MPSLGEDLFQKTKRLSFLAMDVLSWTRVSPHEVLGDLPFQFECFAILSSFYPAHGLLIRRISG